ncbi:two-component system sensor histidine kinase ChvG [Altererythrobacter atlanticus]|uniref:histidine kinase n=1 Tax=Croceibacterium atlanticum TaxID=1267766 RepID=A0A0F7KTC2_9SPHN|nr:ATP-binding protein [Croceibacterium atlanticum]AKH42045.1 Heme sensor protein HssS [Croceibacterium atlanticum]MBB5733387.1 two-component system sensor histidine kinase ChvG [Croceibacterium atlanticum]
MAEKSAAPRHLERLAFPLDTSLTVRILAVNLIPLMLLAGSLFFLDSYRRQLLDERFKLARIEAQITAEALAGATRERQEALLVQIGKEQHLRLRLFDPQGKLTADSFKLDAPSFTLGDPVAAPWPQDLARWIDRAVDIAVNAPSPPPFADPESDEASAWPELVRAREQGLSQIELRRAPDLTPVITAAAPVGLNGSTLLTTRNAADITQAVRDARTSLLGLMALALTLSIVLSLYLARTIIEPLRRLVRATVRVRLGRGREVEVPRMQSRGDEIGVLARAVSDMTTALRQRIDAVESFAADVAHEIKNPLASLRSALESLPRVDDPQLRTQLTEIAAHDVLRIDRLVTEISDASRIDAELSRATFESVDMAELVANVVRVREGRGLNDGRRILIERSSDPTRIMGVPLRIERIIENLLDNAVSFSPHGGVISVAIERDGDIVRTSVCDEGPGIPEKAREKVFTRFHSVRPEAEDFGDHSGLGLAIARTIAVAHDGSLRVSDRPDEHPGACLVLELPAAE